jgi:hypothetical protein
MLSSNTFNAQRVAHRLLREAHDYRAREGRPLPEVMPGVAAPDKAAAHLRLTAEADMDRVPLSHPRVALVRRWIDMSSGVRV